MQTIVSPVPAGVVTSSWLCIPSLMVRLDPTLLRYMGREEFRVLTAVEMGMKNHDIVPQQVIASISGLRGGTAHRALEELHKYKMLWHSSAPYDGFRLTYAGYDYLALHALSKRGTVTAVGTRVGVGKESDIYLAQNADGLRVAMKLHRLGRTSFRAVKSKRDYLRGRKHAGWLYLSRLAAEREFAFMKVLYENGFPVPKPVDQSRHAVVMQFIEGSILANVTELAHPGRVYNEIMELIVRLAACGLIHCDCNEFNLIVSEKGAGSEQEEEKASGAKPKRLVTLIDFPQMVSTSHPNAQFYFDRDVECIRTFFNRRYAYCSERWPVFARDVVVTPSSADAAAPESAAGAPASNPRLDIAVEASGCTVAEGDRAAFEEMQEQLRTEAREAPSDSAADYDGDSDDEEGEGSAPTADDATFTPTIADKESDGDAPGDASDSSGDEGVDDVAIDRHKISQEVQKQIGVKQKVPVSKLGNPQKGRKKRAIRESMTDQ